MHAGEEISDIEEGDAQRKPLERYLSSHKESDLQQYLSPHADCPGIIPFDQMSKNVFRPSVLMQNAANDQNKIRVGVHFSTDLLNSVQAPVKTTL